MGACVKDVFNFSKAYLAAMDQEDSGTTEMFQGCRDERKWIAEFHCNTIQ